MAVVLRWLVVLAAVASAFGPMTVQAVEMAGPDRAAPAESDEPPSAFDGTRKPPIPVSFLSSEGGWIQFQYPPSARERVGPIIAEADDLRADLADILGQAPLDGVEVRVARGSDEMSTLAPWATPPTPQGNGVSYAKLRLMVLSLGVGGEPADLGVAFRRELARMALVNAVGGRALPAWLLEGFAEHFSRDAKWTRALSLYRLVLNRRPNSAAELDTMLEPADGEPARLALAESADFIGFLLQPERRPKFAAVVGELRRGQDTGTAVRFGFGTNLALLERKWSNDLGRRTTLATIYVFLGCAAVLLCVGALARFFRKRRARVASQVVGPGGPAVSSDRTRVHIVFSRRDERIEPPIVPEAEIPKVEHEGEWHTLH